MALSVLSDQGCVSVVMAAAAGSFEQQQFKERRACSRVRGWVLQTKSIKCLRDIGLQTVGHGLQSCQFVRRGRNGAAAGKQRANL